MSWLVVVVMMVLAFYMGRAVERMGAPLPLPDDSAAPRALGGGPYRQVALPPHVAPEASMLLSNLREAVAHVKSIADESNAALDDIEREVKALSRTT